MADFDFHWHLCAALAGDRGYISYTTGKKEEEGKTVSGLYLFDRLPTEFALGLLLAAGFGLWLLFLFIYGNIYDSILYRSSRATLQQLAAVKQYVLAMIGGFGLLSSLTVCLFWYSFVRRLQCGNLWKNSIFFQVCRGIGRIKSSAGKSQRGDSDFHALQYFSVG